MENELFKLVKELYHENHSLILNTIIFSVISSTFDSIFIPRMTANIFNSVNDSEKLKSNLITLVGFWIIVKLSYTFTSYYRKQLEPEITKFITLKLIKAVFKKYEQENEIINVSVLINKIHLIKKVLQELSYLLCTVFIPRIIVLLFSFYNIYTINPTMGIIIMICVPIQIILLTYNVYDCVDKSFEDLENKDELYDYIEDLFYNVDIVQSIPNGFNKELKNLVSLLKESKDKESESLDCLSYKQNQGYIINIIIFAVILYFIYNLYMLKQILSTDITKLILSISGLFDNMYEMSYYIPELVNKLGIIKNNEKFLQTLLVASHIEYSDINLDKYNIKFEGVSFNYKNNKILDNFTLTIKENNFICLYGPSGSGKSTFLKLIFGIVKPQIGTIKIGEHEIYHNKIGMRKYITYINQNSSKLFNKSVYDNIIYGYKNTPEIREQIINTFIKFNFYDIFENLDKNKEKWSFLDQNVGKLGDKLSGGQKQIIHLLSIDLNKNSKIIILDEISSAIDNKMKENVAGYIKYLKQKNKTILLITHDEYFKTICDNVLQFFEKENPTFF